MDLFESLVILQPGKNLALLDYLLIPAQIIFLLYSGVLLGSMSLSIWLNSSARKKGNEHHSWLAKDMINLITGTKIFGFGMGLMPLLAICLIYLQLLHGLHSPVMIYLLISFLAYIAGISMIHIYKQNSDVNFVFEFMKKSIKVENEDKSMKEYIDFHEEYRSQNTRTGFWGVVFMAFSLWMFIGCTVFAVVPDKWNWLGTVFGLLFYPAVLIKFVNFLAVALSITGAAMMIKKFRWEDEPTFADESYISFVKKFTMSLALIFSVIQPIFFVLNLVATPDFALSGVMFLTALIAMVLIFLVAHFLNQMIRDSHYRHVQASFYILIAVFGLIVVKEQWAFTLSNRENQLNIAAGFEKDYEELLAASGRAAVKANGEEIYSARCEACHKFDVKLIGPPHKEVLPKYVKNKEALIKFLLNPVKVNPAYPPMPNPALKPNEAEAVATYMIEKLGPKLK